MYIAQVSINIKRDNELAKLRKLLEEVHLEAEETAHMLRKKHQEAVNDFQDQLEIVAKSKAKLVVAVSSLYSTLDLISYKRNSLESFSILLARKRFMCCALHCIFGYIFRVSDVVSLAFLFFYVFFFLTND